MFYDLPLNPNMVYNTISFFTEGFKNLIRQSEEYNLILDDTFHYTGSIGYTDELPKDNFNPQRVRVCDMWGVSSPVYN